jgi:hypothetical protein
MTEVEVNGTTGYELDFAATRAALSSSSTALRIGTLSVLEERLSNKSRVSCSAFLL